MSKKSFFAILAMALVIVMMALPAFAESVEETEAVSEVETEAVSDVETEAAAEDEVAPETTAPIAEAEKDNTVSEIIGYVVAVVIAVAFIAFVIWFTRKDNAGKKKK